MTSSGGHFDVRLGGIIAFKQPMSKFNIALDTTIGTLETPPAGLYKLV